MKERRWVSMNEVFEQLEEAEMEHALQLWERREEDAARAAGLQAVLAAARRSPDRAAR